MRNSQVINHASGAILTASVTSAQPKGNKRHLSLSKTLLDMTRGERHPLEVSLTMYTETLRKVRDFYTRVIPPSYQPQKLAASRMQTTDEPAWGQLWFPRGDASSQGYDLNYIVGKHRATLDILKREIANFVTSVGQLNADRNHLKKFLTLPTYFTAAEYARVLLLVKDAEDLEAEVKQLNRDFHAFFPASVRAIPTLFPAIKNEATKESNAILSELKSIPLDTFNFQSSVLKDVAGLLRSWKAKKHV